MTNFFSDSLKVVPILMQDMMQLCHGLMLQEFCIRQAYFFDLFQNVSSTGIPSLLH